MDLATLLFTYRYLFVFALAAFDGPLASFIVGVFVASDHLLYLPTFLALVAGDISACIGFFALGHYGGRLEFVQTAMKKAALNGHVIVLKRLWYDHPAKTMFMSKLAYGLSTPFIISAGVVGLKWRTFLILVSAVAASQYAVLLTLATVLGNYLGAATDIFGWLKIGVAIVLAIVIIYMLVGRRVRGMLIAEEREVDRQSAE